METLLYVVVRFSSLELQELSVTRHRALSNTQIFIPAFEAFVHRAFSSFDLKRLGFGQGGSRITTSTNPGVREMQFLAR